MHITEGGKSYNIESDIEEIIINGKSWINPNPLYMPFATPVPGNVDIKFNCKESDEINQVSKIYTDDNRTWVRKIKPLYPYFAKSGIDWIHWGCNATKSWGSWMTLPDGNRRRAYTHVFNNRWVMFKESTDICRLDYGVGEGMYIFFISDHPVDIALINITGRYSYNDPNRYPTYSSYNDVNYLTHPNDYGINVDWDSKQITYTKYRIDLLDGAYSYISSRDFCMQSEESNVGDFFVYSAGKFGRFSAPGAAQSGLNPHGLRYIHIRKNYSDGSVPSLLFDLYTASSDDELFDILTKL